ncbi:LexA family protein [Burkholderia gladioli]|uniref:LexA family protein n=1 Tax=Burkholderia gladioli TaxID=28095 RepID=UPI0015E661F5|nr:LexA family transcriptional regulator [Burkholderia gladioli]MBA1366240.1 LexA family transcriptional regulator [Burkholderia gladioli]
MNTLDERVRTILKETEAEQIELAEAAGVTKGTVTQWLDGKIKSMKLEYAVGIQKRWGYNPVWLVLGSGPKKPAKAAMPPLPNGSRRVPLVNYVQAGLMAEAVEPFAPGAASEYLLTDVDVSDHAFALEIAGDSMRPEFNPGDRVIVDPELAARPGDFVVAKNGRDEATFKRYRVRGINASGQEVFDLVPLNQDYPTISSDVQPAQIIAVMVEHRRYRKK